MMDALEMDAGSLCVEEFYQEYCRLGGILEINWWES